MKTPLWIALGINLANIALDYYFHIRLGRDSGPGCRWRRAGELLWSMARRDLDAVGIAPANRSESKFKLGRWLQAAARRAGSLYSIGFADDLCAFLPRAWRRRWALRRAAAHQVIRQVWFFTALVTEALATTAQSLVGYFFGSSRLQYARRVAMSTTLWSLATGIRHAFRYAGRLRRLCRRHSCLTMPPPFSSPPGSSRRFHSR